MTPLDFVSYPYSHSLLALVAWGVLFGVIYVVATRSRVAAGVMLGLLVVSHWVLDVITHRPDHAADGRPAPRGSVWDCGIRVPARSPPNC